MKKMRQFVITKLRTRLIAVFVSTMLLATGCPELSVTELSLAPESIGAGKLTLLARAEVHYEREMCELKENGRPVDKDCEPDSEVFSSNGLIGLWLPEGWQVDEARVTPALGVESEVLASMEYLTEAFPQTFPYAAGKWWPFISTCKEIRDGLTVFNLEFDISGDATAEEIGVGIALTETGYGEEQVSIDGLEMVAQINLISGTIESQIHGSTSVPNESPQKEKVKWCTYMPEPVERGPRGCSCNAVGKGDSLQSRLLPGLLKLFRSRL
ncbi:MAG: hypothetical protein GY847_11235 [Proteobacteria bacterium]|nr:hypothetical protein [Pseudomonadota bacterium]